MGYEIRMSVMEKYHLDNTEYSSGSKIGMLELSKIGGGALDDLIREYRNSSNPDKWGLFGDVAINETIYNIRNKSKRKDEFVGMSDEDLKYILELAGDSELKKDYYDDDLIGIPATKVLEALKENNEKDTYRRYRIAITLLESVLNEFDKEDIYCVFFGH